MCSSREFVHVRLLARSCVPSVRSTLAKINGFNPESIDTTRPQAPGFSRGVSRAKLTPGCHMLKTPMPGHHRFSFNHPQCLRHFFFIFVILSIHPLGFLLVFTRLPSVNRLPDAWTFIRQKFVGFGYFFRFVKLLATFIYFHVFSPLNYATHVRNICNIKCLTTLRWQLIADHNEWPKPYIQ